MIVCVLSFCNPLFIQSVHALRQMLATAILLYAISYKVENGKQCWLLLLISFLMHSSVIVFLPLIVLPILYKRFSILRFILILIVLTFAIVASQFLIPMMQSSGDDTLIEFATHAENSMNNNEMSLGLKGFLLYNLPIMLFTVISFIRLGWTNGDLVIYYFLYFIVFCFVVFNPVSTELSLRYGFYIWSLIPYSLIAFVTVFKNQSKIYIEFITIFFSVVFFYLLSRDPNFPNLGKMFLTIFPMF